ncbi:Ig-like domain-containing protein [Planococcus faecalis]|uniref:Ig-like domain-containing protein n=1 Tax=Planococcus faecalis TaxID=1598147 RepID=UPI0015A6EF96|nr:Ig-like domain-containing protein [Planococcus faecalis]
MTGKVEANATVTAKVGKTVLGSVKADAKGNYSVKIKAQKTGTTIEVTAKDKAGNISNKTTKVVVKK